MRINSATKSPLKIIGMLIGVTCLVVAGWLYYAHSSQKWPFPPPHPEVQPIKMSSVDYKAPSTSQSDSGSSIKQQAADSQNVSTNTDQSQGSRIIPITITSVQPGTVVYIRAIIGTVTSTGICSLSMTGPEGKTYKTTADIQAMASSSTCKGFDIPMASLSSGKWSITISVTDGSASGQATKEETL